MSALADTPSAAVSRPGFDDSADPRTGLLGESIRHSTRDEVAEAVRAASAAAAQMAAAAPIQRRDWVEAIIDSLQARRAELVTIADEETGLGRQRLSGELDKAAANARFYTEVAVDGSFIDASWETNPDGTVLARWNAPVGPVAVFGASNFPFAYGSFGHDVASAICAGCPVVVKAHPAHPRLAQRIAHLVVEALRRAGAPEGSYGSVVGFDAGIQLVDDPRIRAVGFTGSQAGGMALTQRCASRGVPVFAEMGTLNPVIVLPDATADRDKIAAGFVASFTLGSGQYCTKPGLLLAPARNGFPEAIRAELDRVGPQLLLTRRIADTYQSRLHQMAAAVGDQTETLTRTTQAGFSVDPQLLLVRPEHLTDGSPLLEECFGPVALLCEYSDLDEALDTVTRMQPSLAASVFTSSNESDESVSTVTRLLPQVGRVAVNTWPTGVVASWSQQHGGPWPATSRPDATSVGAGALRRFVRAVAIQNGVGAAVTPALAVDNPWAIPQRVDGKIRA